MNLCGFSALTPGNYFRVPRESGRNSVTPEMDTLQEPQSGFGICLEFVITHETLPHYRLSSRGTEELRRRWHEQS